jgi:DNA repair protein RadC
VKTIQTYSIKKEKTDFPAKKITTSKESELFMRQFWSHDIDVFESFFLLLMNRSNITTGYVKISQGGITGTIVDIKIIAKYVLDNLACSCIIAHNHPSGNLQPSSADLSITQKIKDILNILDCKLIDHLILTENSYYSFADESIL